MNNETTPLNKEWLEVGDEMDGDHHQILVARYPIFEDQQGMVTFEGAQQLSIVR